MGEDDLRERLLVGMEIMHEQYQRREAAGWLVLCYAEGEVDEFGADAIVGAYGPFESPEIALIELVKHDESSDEDFKNVIVPLYPNPEWKDER